MKFLILCLLLVLVTSDTLSILLNAIKEAEEDLSVPHPPLFAEVSVAKRASKSWSCNDGYQKVCENCEYKGDEINKGKMSLLDCKKKCSKDDSCKGIDYGGIGYRIGGYYGKDLCYFVTTDLDAYEEQFENVGFTAYRPCTTEESRAEVNVAERLANLVEERLGWATRTESQDLINFQKNLRNVFFEKTA